MLQGAITDLDTSTAALKGPAVANVAANGDLETSFLGEQSDLAKVPLHTLLAEVDRLQRLVGVDEENRRKYNTLTEKITVLNTEVAGIERDIAGAELADEKIKKLLEERSRYYGEIVDALIEEQAALEQLYAPVSTRLTGQSGALGKLSFRVRRLVYLRRWAVQGEGLLDLRKSGAFQGKGALEAAARAELLPAWFRGTGTVVADAMSAFRSKYSGDLLSHCPIDPSDRAGRREWAMQISDWLYGTQHLSVSYSVEYDGVDIEQLSPGTRGIVLLLLYLSLDLEDGRPLIIDQPEENLDPKSIFDELVGRFKDAKQRRQIIIVTHNANLVVNTDADQVIVASAGPHRPGKLPEIAYLAGGLENSVIRGQVCEILEGGEAAFKERARRLRVETPAQSIG